MRKTAAFVAKAAAIAQRLADHFPDAHTELRFNGPFEFVVAAILSAQCTDARVNIVTAELFKSYRTPADFAALTEPQLEPLIKQCGLYKNKAKNIIACARCIESEYGGKIPSDREQLQNLPGVGRKTANVILSTLYDIPAFAVDTHVFRVSRRLGLSKASNPAGVEKDMTNIYPPDQWIALHHRIIFHGRRICHARRPSCQSCNLTGFCSYYQSAKDNQSI